MKKLRISRRGNLFKIVEQPHRGTDFNKSLDFFTASNGFTISSIHTPQVMHRMTSRYWYMYDYGLFVRGDMIRDDNNIVQAPDEKWIEDLKVAVREYNERFKDS